MAAQPVTEAWPALVVLPAEIDMTNADDVRDQITGAMKPGVRIVIADMAATTFCDSSGIRALLLAHEWGARDGAGLRLLRPAHAVTRTLELLGADQVLTIYESLEEAVMP